MGVFLPFSLSSAYRDAASSSSPSDLILAAKPDQGSPLPTLISVVVESILEVFFLCAVGWFMAKKGIVDDKAKKTLNKINTSLFTPCLLFNKVAFSLTPDKLAELWIIPVGFVFVSSFSAGVAYLFGRLVGLKKGQRNFAIACATFQNSNSLPIALMQSLIGEKLPLAWGPHDTKDAMLGRGLSYLVLFSSLGIIVRWSIGVRLLTSAETEQDEPAPASADPEAALPASSAGSNADASSSETTLRASTSASEINASGEDEEEEGREGVGEQEGDALLKHKPSTGSILKPSSSSTSHSRQASSGSKLVILPSDPVTTSSQTVPSSFPASLGNNGQQHQRKLRKQRGRIFQSFPNSRATSIVASSEGGRSDDEDLDTDEELSDFADEDDAEWGARRGFGRRFLSRSSFLGRFGRGVKKAGKKTWRGLRKFGRKVGEFMTVPLWAAVLSLVVACIPPLQSVLNEAEPLKAAIRSAGACSVPITLVTLGAYFYRPSSTSSSSTSPLRAVDDPQPTPSPSSPRLFSSTLLRRLRNPFAPLPPLSSTLPRGSGRGETRTVVVAVVTRMVLVPLCLIPLFAWYAKATVNVADDPVFVVVACLLIGSPTVRSVLLLGGEGEEKAITLAQISSAAGTATFEALISRTLLISYAFLTAPTTIALVLAALWIDKLQHPEKALVDAASAAVGGMLRRA
ncbi:hypothetical protein JCM8547_008383 [Rhodosporidiobolus lusitaniae]